MIEFPSIVTVGATSRISDDPMLSVTTSFVFASVFVELFDVNDVVTVGLVMSMVTAEPSVVEVNAEAPKFSFSS